jgi:transcriptional regulator with XRE-family HTH domain
MKTTPSSPSGAKPQARPGAILKALRAQNGWTLAEVSERTGMTVSHLSKVENDKVALSFDKLVLLSEGLGVDIARFFGSAGADADQPQGATRRSIARVGEGQSIAVERGHYLYVAADLLKKRMTPIIGEVFAKDVSEYNKYQKHSGEEYVYVLEGTLDLYTDTYTPVRLEQGDSIYFDSVMGHAYVKVGDHPCRILSICATPDADMIESLAREADLGRALKTTPAQLEHAEIADAKPRAAKRSR